MATTTLKGVNRTNTVAVPTVKAPPGEQHGKVHGIYDSYTWTTNSVINDVVTLGADKIPAGARIVGATVSCTDDNGSAGKYSLGWGASDDAVESAAVAGFILDFAPQSTGGNVASSCGGGPATTAIATSGIHKTFASACDLKLKCTEASDVGSGTITVKASVLYMLD